MIAFEKYHFPFIHYILTWHDDNALHYQYRSITNKTEKHIPLAYMHPEVKFVRHTSIMAGLLIFLTIALMFIVAVDCHSNPASWKNSSDFISAELTAFMIATFSFWYFWHSTRKRMVFYFKNEEVAFELLYQKTLDSFKDEFLNKSIQASFTEDNKTIEFLKKEIPKLTKDKIISQEFGDILRDRLITVTKFD